MMHYKCSREATERLDLLYLIDIVSSIRHRMLPIEIRIAYQQPRQSGAIGTAV